MILKGACFAGEVGEHKLGRVVRAVVVPAELAQCGGIDQVEVPLNQFREGRLRSVLDIGS